MRLIGYIIIKPKYAAESKAKPHYMAGINAIIYNKFQLHFVLFSFIANLILAPFYTYILPILILKTYGYGTVMLGIIDGLSAGAGLIAAAFASKLLNKYLGVRFSTIASLLSVGVSLLIIVIGANIYFLAFGVFAIGLALNIALINIATITTIATPDRIRPASAAVSGAIAVLSNPIGIAFVSYIGHVNVVLLIFAILYLILTLSFLFSKDLKILASTPNEELEDKFVDMYPKAYMT